MCTGDLPSSNVHCNVSVQTEGTFPLPHPSSGEGWGPARSEMGRSVQSCAHRCTTSCPLHPCPIPTAQGTWEWGPPRINYWASPEHAAITAVVQGLYSAEHQMHCIVWKGVAGKADLWFKRNKAGQEIEADPAQGCHRTLIENSFQLGFSCTVLLTRGMSPALEGHEGPLGSETPTDDKELVPTSSATIFICL